MIPRHWPSATLGCMKTPDEDASIRETESLEQITVIEGKREVVKRLILKGLDIEMFLLPHNVQLKLWVKHRDCRDKRSRNYLRRCSDGNRFSGTLIAPSLFFIRTQKQDSQKQTYHNGTNDNHKCKQV